MQEIEEYIDAWILHDNEKMAEVQQLFKNEKAIYKTLTALTNFVNGSHSNAEDLKIILKAIEARPVNINYFSVLLFAGSICSFSLGLLTEFNRIIKIFENIDLKKIKKQYEGLFYLSKSKESLKELAHFERINFLAKAEACFPIGSEIWYGAKFDKTYSSVLIRKDIKIFEEVKILNSYPQYLKRRYSPDFVLGRYYEFSGNLEKAYQIIKGLREITTKKNFKAIYFLKIVNLLWMMNKIEEADLELEKFLKIQPDYLESFRGKTYLAERGRALNDPATIRLNVKKAFLREDLPLFNRRWLEYLLLCAELLDGNAKVAKNILLRIDPKGDNPDLVVDWMRYYLLINDYQTAAHYYDQLMKRHKSYICEFIYVYEVKHHQMVRLQLLIDNKDMSKVKIKNNDLGALKPSFDNFIGSSASLKKVKDAIKSYSNQKAPILITGETGTGKEEVAKILHNISDRSKHPFIPVNCGGISNTLMEAEFFGYKKGAFTGALKDHKGLFESAGKGTIFLDEISSMPMNLQASLLRVLENMEVRPVGSSKFIPVEARIIAATNIPLESLLDDKKFRSDLYFRLNRLQINLPPLRKRTSDIPEIIEYFLNNQYDEDSLEIDSELMGNMLVYDWPGNVRELKNEIERMVILGESYQFKAQTSSQADEPKADHEVIASPTHSSINDSNAITFNIVAHSTSYGNARLKKLAELFLKDRQLTRAMVVRKLGCAPNTATKDLKELESQGFIKKIIPTDSPRSSYYIINDNE